ncbi:MAG: hypothetical protein KBI47_04360 [Armatimonadetes bacterium]|jgi:hypothetical protein|nr:hypothetical protein [Armatimonadota bacterium]MDI9584519.1 hypothetical protein [Acidobacteriota bacterium]
MPNRLMPTLAALALCASIPLLAGCGTKGLAGTTAKATAEGFAAALAKQDFALAATAFDYTTSARQQNENWDDIPKGQRDLIIGKLQEERAAALSVYASRLGGNARVGSEQGDTVVLQGDAGSLSLKMMQSGGKYYIAQVW